MKIKIGIYLICTFIIIVGLLLLPRYFSSNNSPLLVAAASGHTDKIQKLIDSIGVNNGN